MVTNIEVQSKAIPSREITIPNGNWKFLSARGRIFLAEDYLSRQGRRIGAAVFVDGGTRQEPKEVVFEGEGLLKEHIISQGERIVRAADIRRNKILTARLQEQGEEIILQVTHKGR